MPPIRSSGAFAGYAASKVASSAWKRYNPWRKGGRWGPKRPKGKMRVSTRYYEAPEVKFHDLTVTDALVAAGANIAKDSCNLITAGTGESERIGRKITIRGIEWRYGIELKIATDPAKASDMIRVILYQDKQANGVTAAAGDIMEDLSWSSMYNLTNRDRFRILFDKVHQLNATAGGGNGSTLDVYNHQVNHVFKKRLKIRIEYSGAAATMTNIRSNNIGVLLLSKDGVCLFDSRMRISFTG